MSYNRNNTQKMKGQLMQILSLSKTVNDETKEQGISVSYREDNGNVKNLFIFDSSPNWSKASDALDCYVSGSMSSSELADAILQATDFVPVIQEKLVRVSGLDGRLTISNNHVLFDGDPIDPVLEDHIFKLLNEDGTPRDELNWRSFTKFVENLYGNVLEDVRTQLFGWLKYEESQGHGFTLTPDGCFIGYKGCAGTVDAPVSVNHGTAFVNDEKHTGAIPNNVGSVVTMARSSVQHDPRIGCSTGLHVGTYDYASGWARGVLLTVKVNPRDVVSVPTECDAQKIRTCRYEVLEVVDGPNNSLTWGDDYGDDWEDDDDYGVDRDYGYCDECGDEASYTELDNNNGLCDECADEIGFCANCGERYDYSDLDEDNICYNCADSEDDYDGEDEDDYEDDEESSIDLDDFVEVARPKSAYERWVENFTSPSSDQ